MSKKKEENLIYLAKFEGKSVYWDSESGLSKPNFVIKEGNLVQYLPLPSLKSSLEGKVFSEHKPNVWF